MKNKLSVLNLILVAMCLISTLACGFLNRGNNNSSSLSANNANSNTNVSANTISVANLPTPYPAANCRSNFSMYELKDGRYKEYQGCTVTFHGTLISVKDESVSIVEPERMDLVFNANDLEKGGVVTCRGDFSDNTSHLIGQKLESLKLDRQFRRLPTVTFKATIENNSLSDCSMVSVQK